MLFRDIHQPAHRAKGVEIVGSTASQTPGLRRVMQGTEYFTLAFGSIVGVGWLVVMEDWLTRGGPLGAILAFLAGGLALVPVALVYGRLAQQMPEAASEIAYTAAVFPRPVSFLTGWSMTFAYLVVCPFEAVAIGRLAAYAFPALDSFPLYQVGGSTVFLPHVLLGITLTAGIILINCLGIHFMPASRPGRRSGCWPCFASLPLWVGGGAVSRRCNLCLRSSPVPPVPCFRRWQSSLSSPTS